MISCAVGGSPDAASCFIDSTLSSGAPRSTTPRLVRASTRPRDAASISATERCRRVRAPRDLFVQPFEHVRAVQLPLVLTRKAPAGERVLGGLFQERRRLGEACSQPIGDLAQLRQRACVIRLRKNRRCCRAARSRLALGAVAMRGFGGALVAAGSPRLPLASFTSRAFADRSIAIVSRPSAAAGPDREAGERGALAAHLYKIQFTVTKTTHDKL